MISFIGGTREGKRQGSGRRRRARVVTNRFTRGSRSRSQAPAAGRTIHAMLDCSPLALALAALSLVLPSEPSYDPWAWIVWGREIAFLGLDTTGGPSWKPLPVAFTRSSRRSACSTDDLPPACGCWLARAGVLLAMAMAFRLARRLAGPGRRGRGRLRGRRAGACLTPEWFRYAAHGNEAPLALALMLWAWSAIWTVCVARAGAGLPGVPVASRGCSRSWRRTALWLWLRRAAPRPLLAGASLALPCVWLVPEWIGSGDPAHGGSAGAQRAVLEPLARRAARGCGRFERFHDDVGPASGAAGRCAALSGTE